MPTITGGLMQFALQSCFTTATNTGIVGINRQLNIHCGAYQGVEGGFVQLGLFAQFVLLEDRHSFL